jgi:hypothetical protein
LFLRDGETKDNVVEIRAGRNQQFFVVRDEEGHVSSAFTIVLNRWTNRLERRDVPRLWFASVANQISRNESGVIQLKSRLVPALALWSNTGRNINVRVRDVSAQEGVVVTATVQIGDTTRKFETVPETILSVGNTKSIGLRVLSATKPLSTAGKKSMIDDSVPAIGEVKVHVYNNLPEKVSMLEKQPKTAQADKMPELPNNPNNEQGFMPQGPKGNQQLPTGLTEERPALALAPGIMGLVARAIPVVAVVALPSEKSNVELKAAPAPLAPQELRVVGQQDVLPTAPSSLRRNTDLPEVFETQSVNVPSAPTSIEGTKNGATNNLPAWPQKQLASISLTPSLPVLQKLPASTASTNQQRGSTRAGETQAASTREQPATLGRDVHATIVDGKLFLVDKKGNLFDGALSVPVSRSVTVVLSVRAGETSLRADSKAAPALLRVLTDSLKASGAPRNLIVAALLRTDHAPMSPLILVEREQAGTPRVVGQLSAAEFSAVATPHLFSDERTASAIVPDTLSTHAESVLVSAPVETKNISIRNATTAAPQELRSTTPAALPTTKPASSQPTTAAPVADKSAQTAVAAGTKIQAGFSAAAVAPLARAFVAQNLSAIVLAGVVTAAASQTFPALRGANVQTLSAFTPSDILAIAAGLGGALAGGFLSGEGQQSALSLLSAAVLAVPAAFAASDAANSLPRVFDDVPRTLLAFVNFASSNSNVGAAAVSSVAFFGLYLAAVSKSSGSTLVQMASKELLKTEPARVSMVRNAVLDAAALPVNNVEMLGSALRGLKAEAMLIGSAPISHEQWNAFFNQAKDFLNGGGQGYFRIVTAPNGALVPALINLQHGATPADDKVMIRTVDGQRFERAPAQTELPPVVKPVPTSIELHSYAADHRDAWKNGTGFSNVAEDAGVLLIDSDGRSFRVRDTKVFNTLRFRSGGAQLSERQREFVEALNQSVVVTSQTVVPAPPAVILRPNGPKDLRRSTERFFDRHGDLRMTELENAYADVLADLQLPAGETIDSALANADAFAAGEEITVLDRAYRNIHGPFIPFHTHLGHPDSFHGAARFAPTASDAIAHRALMKKWSKVDGTSLALPGAIFHASGELTWFWVGEGKNAEVDFQVQSTHDTANARAYLPQLARAENGETLMIAVVPAKTGPQVFNLFENADGLDPRVRGDDEGLHQILFWERRLFAIGGKNLGKNFRLAA